jgi:hypothetical protein
MLDPPFHGMPAEYTSCSHIMFASLTLTAKQSRLLTIVLILCDQIVKPRI